MSDSVRLNYLIYSPCVTASFSIVGSCLTVLTLYRSQRLRRQRDRKTTTPSNCRNAAPPLRTYHRLLLGISCSDICMSIGFALGPLPIPAELGIPGAHGTMGTCVFQAILLQVGTASIPYSTMLLLYYLLVVRYRWRDGALARYVEPWMHAIPISYHVTTAILGVAWQVFNPRSTSCWVAAYPYNCNEMPGVQCERGGEYVDLFGIWLLTIPFMIWNLILLALIAAIAWTVVERLRASRRFVFRPNVPNPNSSNSGGSGSGSCSDRAMQTNGNGSSQPQRPNYRPSSTMSAAENQTRQVLVQCFLYAGTFCNMMIWSTLGTILYLAKVPYDIVAQQFWIAALAVFFLPAQGFFNFLIFIRPRYLDKRKQAENSSRWRALGQAIWNPGANPSSEQAQPRRRNFNQNNIVHGGDAAAAASSGGSQGVVGVVGVADSCCRNNNSSSAHNLNCQDNGNNNQQRKSAVEEPEEIEETGPEPRAYDSRSQQHEIVLSASFPLGLMLPEAATTTTTESCPWSNDMLPSTSLPV